MSEPKRSAKGELKKLTELFNSVYLIKDRYILKTILAGVVSQQLKSDPVWIVIIAPSGGAKSEFINAITKCVGVFPLSTLTSKTFVSGMKGRGEETSLLLKIQNGIITFKDLTSLLSEHKEERSVIMAQLREIYDGKYAKTFGTGETVEWGGKITILAGSTYAIHTLKQQYTAMGERFLFYNMIQPDRIEAGRRTMENQEDGKMAELRNMLATSTGHYANELIVIPKEMPRITAEFRDEILSIAELATRARSAVERNWRSPQQDITEVHPPEMPTRFAGQLQVMARSLMIINWNETGELVLLDEDKIILYKLALDSIDKSRRITMQELSKYDTLTTTGLAVKLELKTNTIRRWLEDLVALEIAERVKKSGNKGDDWLIKEKYRTIITRYEGIAFEGHELIDDETDLTALVREAQEIQKNEKVEEEIDVKNLGL